jgi:hypothetical protein
MSAEGHCSFMNVEIDQCVKEVDTILSKKGLKIEDLHKELINSAKRIAISTIGKRINDSCDTEYDPEQCPEIVLWALGLVCEIWTLEILRQKTQEGHCYTHKKKTGEPCPIGSRFHENLFNEAKKSFQDVLIREDLLRKA